MEVIWTQEAERQLLVLAEYYRQSAGSVTASGIIQRILDAVACLADSPHVGQYLVRRGQAYRAVMVPAVPVSRQSGVCFIGAPPYTRADTKHPCLFVSLWYIKDICEESSPKTYSGTYRGTCVSCSRRI